MNLQQLESALPKPWLNIQCNRLTANEVVVPVASKATFAYYSAVSNIALPSLANLQTVCNQISILNANYNVATNIFTAPRAVDLLCTFAITVASTAAQNLAYSVVFIVNGLNLAQNEYIQNLVAVPAFTQQTLTISCPVSLNVGDTVGYVFTNLGAGPFLYSTPRFSGVAA